MIVRKYLTWLIQKGTIREICCFEVSRRVENKEFFYMQIFLMSAVTDIDKFFYLINEILCGAFLDMI